MTRRILHLLSQRPSLTGSGVALEALVRGAAERGFEQAVVVGAPADDPAPAVGELTPEHIHPLIFGAAPLDFALPGMSDVMPYPSSRFAALSQAQLAAYRGAWGAHLERVLADFEPDLIHSHHLWLLSSLVKDVAPTVPVVVHVHATGLRQMQLCPHLRDEVRRKLARNERFAVLHGAQQDEVAALLGVDRTRIAVVGSGFREELFHGRGRPPATPTVLYAGKYSHAKGLPWLLDAVERLAARHPGLAVEVAGSGAGAEAEVLRRRMEAMASVKLLGQLSQAELGERMRAASVFVLPSLYEGLPLVLVEAMACGTRLVSTALPGVVAELARELGDGLELVPVPRLRTADEPVADDQPAFVDALEAALERSLAAGPVRGQPVERIRSFTWGAVCERVAELWAELGVGV
jgi:glycosyltransferase involved in cell wall biosynthesis